MYEIDEKRRQCNELVERKRLLDPEHGMACPFYQKTVKAIADLIDEINTLLVQYHDQEVVSPQSLGTYFPTLVNCTEDYLNEQIKFANENPKRLASLLHCFRTITRNGERAAKLFKDHAPHSFYFETDGYNGGVIFHPDGSGSGAEFPVLSVTLDDNRDVWQVHT